MYICNRQIAISGRALRVARLDAEKFHFLSDPKPLVDGLRESEQRVDIFTFMQSLADMKPKYAYPMEWDNLAVLPISTFDEWWNKQIGFKARNKAKQASKKGVEVREVPFDEKLVYGIWQIYNEAPIRQGRRFAHYGKDLETVYKDEATYLDSSMFIGAYQNDELIGFVKLVTDEMGLQAGLMNIVSKIAHRDKSPTNALLAETVRACAKRHIPYLVYSHFAWWNRRRDRLTDFKERNGFQRVDLPRYYVPLTPLGMAAFRLGFHHRLVDRFPDPLGRALRELRVNWTNHRFRPARQGF